MAKFGQEPHPLRLVAALPTLVFTPWLIHLLHMISSRCIYAINTNNFGSLIHLFDPAQPSLVFLYICRLIPRCCGCRQFFEEKMSEIAFDHQASPLTSQICVKTFFAVNRLVLPAQQHPWWRASLPEERVKGTWCNPQVHSHCFVPLHVRALASLDARFATRQRAPVCISLSPSLKNSTSTSRNAQSRVLPSPLMPVLLAPYF